MMSLERVPEPDTLRTNKEAWTASYVERVHASPGKHVRPSGRQYAHPVVRALWAMSFGKCFYCEQPLILGEQEVDHHVETSEDPARVFDWLNLYLSCRGCNDKQPNRSIPNVSCLDPCDPSTRPDEHLTFENDVIRAKSGSERGLKTIQKYCLHRDELSLKRARQLQRFDGILKAILRRMHAEQRPMSDEERAELRRFAQKDHPFSRMFAVKLAAEGL